MRPLNGRQSVETWRFGLKKKDTKTTIAALFAAAMFLTSHPESPVKEIIPEKGKGYAVLAATIGLGLLGRFSADATPDEKPKPE